MGEVCRCQGISRPTKKEEKGEVETLQQNYGISR
jgi:hypothetical protein